MINNENNMTANNSGVNDAILRRCNDDGSEPMFLSAQWYFPTELAQEEDKDNRVKMSGLGFTACTYEIYLILP